MKRSFMRAIVKLVASKYFIEILFLLLCIVQPVMGKTTPKKQSKESNWFLSGNTGLAIRSPEISKSLNFVDDGFRHHPGFAFNLSFGRSIGKHWESAFRLGAYTLFGQSKLPHYSSVSYYVVYPNLLNQEPLEYVTQSNSVSLILRFLFLNDIPSRNNSVNIRPFVEAGLGINNFTTELRYSKIPVGVNSSLIFRERNGENTNGAAQIVTGLGLKIGEQGKWNALILMNAEWVNFSNLNPIHHFSNGKKNSRAIVSRVTAGLSIPIQRSKKTDNYLPFRW